MGKGKFICIKKFLPHALIKNTHTLCPYMTRWSSTENFSLSNTYTQLTPLLHLCMKVLGYFILLFLFTFWIPNFLVWIEEGGIEGERWRKFTCGLHNSVFSYFIIVFHHSLSVFSMHMNAHMYTNAMHYFKEDFQPEEIIWNI